MKLRLSWRGEAAKNQREADSCEANMVGKTSTVPISFSSPDNMALQQSETTQESFPAEVSNLIMDVCSSIVLNKFAHFPVLWY
jgi:hypothetical protein